MEIGGCKRVNLTKIVNKILDDYSNENGNAEEKKDETKQKNPESYKAIRKWRRVQKKKKQKKFQHIK